MRRFLPVLLLLGLVGAAAVPAAYDAGRYTTRMEKASPRLRSMLARYRQAPDAMPADSVYWLGSSLSGGNGEANSHPKLGQRLMEEAEARGSGHPLAARAVPLLFGRQHTAGRALLVEAMRRGVEDQAFFLATVNYAGHDKQTGLPAHPDSLVLFYRSIRPLGGASATQIVRSALDHVATQAEAGDAAARRVRADLQARGLWEIEG